VAEDKFSNSNDEIVPKLIRGIINNFGLVPGPFTDETRDLWLLSQKLAEFAADVYLGHRPTFEQMIDLGAEVNIRQRKPKKSKVDPSSLPSFDARYFTRRVPSDRDIEIWEARRAGKTFGAIAKHFCISYERARQIFLKREKFRARTIRKMRGLVDATQSTDPRRGKWIQECAIDQSPRDVWVED
jgi:hypothetical protein